MILIQMNKVIVDKARLLRRVIIISWASLALCFVIKIFGGDFFEIMSDNPNYKALCEYADSHFWCKYLIAFCSSMVCQSLYMLAILQKYKFKKWELVITTASVLISCYVKYFNNIIGLLFDVWLLLILPAILLKNIKSVWKILIAFALYISFQFISLITKNLSFGFIDNSTFITLIYGIDVYLMCFIYYLYRNYNKEKKDMGMFWTLFMGKPVDKLKAMKAKREEKIAKLQAEVNAIEIEISKRKNEK